MKNDSLKVTPLSVRSQVEAGLRTAITSGRFLPGDHLPDRLLCETFGTSRSVVREAIRLMEAEGLVVVHPNRGPFVATLSMEEAADIYEIRGSLEALAGEGFATRASDDERAELRRVYEELRAAGVDRDQLIDIKRRFYEVLTRGSGNKLIKGMLDRLLIRNSQLRALSLSSEGRLPETLAEIGRIMTAIERKDGAAAAHACRAHIKAAAEVALRILAERETQPEARAGER
ncbi:GntR family transcriptional regulator [Paraburkholderia silvatlantica]|uniref:GntR family transcriptional regulator n=1 Tax=Paraburkholderia silvatlantica TaxID=321895 RepID=A0A2U1AGL5_9BURK|nr:GntR family transcriptional regulator [Paraburkholderia silvatlantica]MBB2928953.1 DNA-binding GntR family transcriptional regulator [Paraburkholderia silvatlantica]PVY35532.1 GntR family transcriptional regulator [Paraburkholderia silvatlantica]PXW41174.1 GntR family transcriptional regulator [Paraburkholderia silvatlantica]PYE27639.1 GntR family transcriptional regulator [Paraburkholderia silvatlantica]TDQ76256.1 GntR family transcriptional regulator [Paraburkholderia silvatlantica]